MMKFDRLPKQIQKTMLKRQFEQLGKEDATTFEDNVCANRTQGGFDWGVTKEGGNAWREAIEKGDFELFYRSHPKRKPKMTRDNFMKFFRDNDSINTLSADDRTEVFRTILTGSSDLMPDLLNEILRDYGVDDVFVDGGETLKELEETRKELEELRLIQGNGWYKTYLSVAKELNAIKKEGGFDAAVNEKIEPYAKALAEAREDLDHAASKIGMLVHEKEALRAELTDWCSVANARKDQIDSLCAEIGELKNKVAQVREESAKYYMSMGGTSYFLVSGSKLTTVSIVLDNASIETEPFGSERDWSSYHVSTKEAFLKAKAKAEGIINNQTV